MPVNILITGLKTVLFISSDASEVISVRSLKEQIESGKSVKEEDYYLVQNGQILSDCDTVELPRDEMITVINAFPRILGGKGGFGSLIRAMGKSTQKSQNTEACRDLSGRRMRDISTEKKLAQWIKDAAEKKKEADEEKKARQERRRAGPKHIFTDHEYMNQIQTNAENIDDALKQGLAASSSSTASGTKRPSTVQPSVKSKKIHLWSGLDDLSDEELSNEENHQGSDNDATCTNLTSSADKVETNSSETDANKSSENSPAVAVENTEDNNVNDDSKITESTSPSSECSRDEKETKEAVITESNASVSEDKPTTENTAPTLDAFEPIDLEKYETAEELISAVAPEHLKMCLQKLGLKCGGTPAQRGERLFATKGKLLSELDPSMFAKPKKQKK